MTPIFAFGLGSSEVILILAVVLLLFGAKKLPELAKGLGQGIKEFKKASNEVTDELHRAVEEAPAPRQKPAPPADTTPTQVAKSTESTDSKQQPPV